MTWVEDDGDLFALALDRDDDGYSECDGDGADFDPAIYPGSATACPGGWSWIHELAVSTAVRDIEPTRDGGSSRRVR